MWSGSSNKLENAVKAEGAAEGETLWAVGQTRWKQSWWVASPRQQRRSGWDEDALGDIWSGSWQIPAASRIPHLCAAKLWAQTRHFRSRLQAWPYLFFS